MAQVTRLGPPYLNAKGRTVGLVGIGDVGSRVARICGKGLEMRVLACDPYLTTEQIQERGAAKVDLPTLLAESNFLSIHCPLNDETRGMIMTKECEAGSERGSACCA